MLKENYLTQDELAEICCVTRQTISNWENGKSYPDRDTLVLLSDSFGVSLDASVCVYLSGENHRQILIPKGFAHGFMVVSECAEIIYKCDEYYHPEDETGIAWNDPQLAIPWPAEDVILSDKDRKNPTLAECRIAFDMKTGAVI